MIFALTMALAASARLTCRFGWEEVSFDEMNDDAYVHQNITKRACKELYGNQPGELPASASLEWHTDIVDSYLYNPVWWAGGLLTGDGLDRLKVATSVGKELESLHFDDLTSVAQIEAMWTRYLSGCVAGLLWAAERDDVPAGHNILGASLHAIQDFYSHSSWVDDPARRAKAWHEHLPLERSRLNLYTGSYETAEHLSQHPHGKVSFECSILRASGVGPVMDLACVGFSPLNKLSPCQIFDRCGDSVGVRTNVLGVQLPQGLVSLDPPGIALDSSWQAEIARQLRDIPSGDPVTAQQLFESAKNLAVKASVWWLTSVGNLLAANADTVAFGQRLLNTDTFGVRRTQYEDFSRLPFLFVASGPYPPRVGSDWDWYLRLQIRTADETDSGTNGSVKVSADGQTFLLDYGKNSSAIVEYNDFSTGDVQSYVVGPFAHLPESLTFSVEGNDVGDILTVIWEGFVGALESVFEALGDFFLSIIGGHADFVAQRKLEWRPEELARIGEQPVPFRVFMDGDDEGQYHVFGSIRRVANDPGTPRRHSTFEVRLDRLECWEESTELSEREEPFLLALLVNLADHNPATRVSSFRTSPASLNKGDSAPVDCVFRARVPDEYGMLALPMAVYESDQETAAARDELLRQFAGKAEEETQSWSDKLVETVGATFGSDWKLGGLEVYAFNRAPVDARAGTVFQGRIEDWIEAGESRTIRLNPNPAWRTWSLPADYVRGWLTGFSLRAEQLFDAHRYDEAVAEIRTGVESVADLHAQHPEISLDEVAQAAQHWLGIAAAAHPHDIPRQLAAARNSWEISSVLARVQLASPIADIEDLTSTAGRLQQLIGYLSFGSTDSSPSVQAAEVLREVYWRTPGDHRLDVAASWSTLAMRHHEIAFHPDQTDAVAELTRQRAAAGEAAAIVFPMAQALPGGELSDAQLIQLAQLLDRLIGTLTFGAGDSAPSVQAADLAVRTYRQLPGDRRIDIGATWATLALRRHEISFVPGHPDPAAEQAGQREAARKAAEILVPIVEALPDPAIPVADLRRMLDPLNRLVGLLTHGAVPEDPGTAALQALSDRTAAAAAKLGQALA